MMLGNYITGQDTLYFKMDRNETAHIFGGKIRSTMNVAVIVNHLTKSIIIRDALHCPTAPRSHRVNKLVNHGEAYGFSIHRRDIHRLFGITKLGRKVGMRDIKSNRLTIDNINAIEISIAEILADPAELAVTPTNNDPAPDEPTPPTPEPEPTPPTPDPTPHINARIIGLKLHLDAVNEYMKTDSNIDISVIDRQLVARVTITI